MEKKDNLGSNKLPASHLVRLAQHRLCKLSPSGYFVTIAGIVTSSSHCSTYHQNLTKILIKPRLSLPKVFSP